MDEFELFKRLGMALAIGLLLGVERGWQMRQAPEGGRIAGIRSFALIGLLGGICGLLGKETGAIALAAGFSALAALVTGFFGGLASSTALTLSFSRMGHDIPATQRLLAAGVAVAAGVMFLRILLIVGILDLALLPVLAIPMGVMAATCFIGAGVLSLDRSGGGASGPAILPNPFDLGTAVKFGLLIAVILILTHLFEQQYGRDGVYTVAAVSGLVDVDAISVALARLARQSPDKLEIAAHGVIIAAFVNTAVKGGIVILLCGGAMAWRVGIVFALSLIAGGLTLAI
ncbi:MAG TPA: DUF4010 domain-containing protein [Telmatospirillum sp.]|nr:DUF4010 domain-containing protein [Telmatospirillum sp.]